MIKINMSLKSLKLITFDATNTLLKFRVPPEQFYAKIARAHGFNGTEDEVKKKLKDNYNVMCEKHPNYGKASILWENWWTEVVKMTLNDNVPVAANLDIIASTLIEEFKTPKCWCIANGVDKLLGEIKKQNICVGIISNFDPRLYDILHNVRLSKNIDFVLTSYDIGYSKPDKRIFQSAIKRCQGNVRPSEAMHVGDDLEKDYEGAKAAGWHAVLINPNIKTETPPAPQHVFSSLEDLCTSIEQQKLIL